MSAEFFFSPFVFAGSTWEILFFFSFVQIVLQVLQYGCAVSIYVFSSLMMMLVNVFLIFGGTNILCRTFARVFFFGSPWVYRSTGWHKSTGRQNLRRLDCHPRNFSLLTWNF